MAIVACSESSTENGGNENENQKPVEQPEITLDATSSDFTTDGGSNVITFNSNVAWTAEVVNTRADAWCTVNPTSGAAGDAKITVTTTANDTPDDRTASIIIKAGTASKTINVSQKQKDALTVTSSKFEVSAEGGEVLIEVKANIDFEYAIEESAADWVEYKATRAMKTSNLVFEVKENDDTDKREAKISITSGEFSEVVTIYQAGAEPTIVISKNEYVVSSDSETIAVDVTSNVDVAVEIPSDVDWITENATRATSTNTYRFDILPNDNYDQREAEIKFTNKANGLSETVKIVQAQKDAIVLAKSEYEFNINGGALDLEIQTNVDLNVTISDDAQSWIHQIETRGLETKTLYFNIDACDENTSRSATITITGGNATQKILVKQKLVIPTNQIWYTSSYGEVVTPYKKDVFGSNIVSNVYENGKGVITFDNSVTSIGDYAFYDCSSLTSIIIPGSVTSIGDWAFSNCSSLARITIPEDVTLTGRAFYDCSSLTAFNGENASDDNRCWIVKGEIKAFAPSGLNTYTIPEGVTSIGESAFTYCSNLTSITIPKGVTSIENQTFEGCI